MASTELIEDTPYRWVLPQRGGMRVPGVVFATPALLPEVAGDQSLVQVRNVATLPGVVRASYAMPDVHWGYGFPIGGVAATDIDAGGVVSPGGVGFDISCGVRLLLSPLDFEEVSPRLADLMDGLRARVPVGMGAGAVWKPDAAGLRAVLERGAREAVDRGFGSPADLARCEDGGTVPGADPDRVSERALKRGAAQLGSLGSGNHFLEVQVVDRVLDDKLAAAFGLTPGRVCVMLHSGSRGLGHQVCTDQLRVMVKAMPRHGIEVVDKQLACVPVRSPEGEAYLGAMAAAANFGQANRQLLCYATRQVFGQVLGTDRLDVLYDVSHNLAKLEWHIVDGRERQLCVHRKGATRALAPGDPQLPADLRSSGQPVLVPGSMGTGSYVLAGLEGNEAFASACHGAGRVMSRSAARRTLTAEQLRQQLDEVGVVARGASWRGLVEEAPLAYKDVDEVVRACEEAGLARIVARLRPVGVVKG